MPDNARSAMEERRHPLSIVRCRRMLGETLRVLVPQIRGLREHYATTLSDKMSRKRPDMFGC